MKAALFFWYSSNRRPLSLRPEVFPSYHVNVSCEVTSLSDCSSPGRKCHFTAMFQCPLFYWRAWRWQISRETGTAQLYWNRLTQCTSATLTSLTAPQIALRVQEVLPRPACSGKAATLTKTQLPTVLGKKKRRRKKRHRTCPFYNYWVIGECASRPQLRQACENM